MILYNIILSIDGFDESRNMKTFKLSGMVYYNRPSFIILVNDTKYIHVPLNFHSAFLKFFNTENKKKFEQENVMRCNNRGNLLQLSFSLKIQYFRRPIYNPVEHL